MQKYKQYRACELAENLTSVFIKTLKRRKKIWQFGKKDFNCIFKRQFKCVYIFIQERRSILVYWAQAKKSLQQKIFDQVSFYCFANKECFLSTVSLCVCSISCETLFSALSSELTIMYSIILEKKSFIQFSAKVALRQRQNNWFEVT